MWGWKFRKRRRSASWWIASAITRRRRGAKDATPEQKAALELEHYRALHPLFGGESDDSPPVVEEPRRTASCYPSVDETNAMPEKFRLYIHDLETRCDKSGDVQTIAILREDRDALQRRVEELENVIAQVALLTHPK
jgi:hypothetical protein